MAHPTKKEFLELTGRYLEGTTSKDEARIIEAYYELFSDQPEIMERIETFGLTPVEQKIKQGIRNRIEELEAIPERKTVTSITKMWYRISAAAVLLISMSVGLYFYLGQSAKYSAMHIQAKNDIAPGTNKAILTLADGKKIMLADVSEGEVALQSGIIISKNKSGELVYSVSADVKGNNSSGLNTISTPRGGQYQVRFADGTMVWLNAESTIKFPSSFSGLKERIVELNGEAYFEVAKVMMINEKDKEHRMPFIVKSRRQLVEVMGTHFNIQNYSDQKLIKTTLLEGAVQVSALNTSPGNTVILKPNQQSVLIDKKLQVSEVDVEETVAWKSGLFMFNEENLESIMQKIARWYNVDIRFDDDALKSKVFSGSFSRFTNVSKVLQKIELTRAARFDVKDGVITLYKY
ncbi:FecR family protein [Pedobacter nyackensis]|uniref:FecR family protein n=1 Tax=Pedobacter nyackensis TaxID=475255 RepID=UPI00292ED90E|nr:FecR domain-containing protein [Pedobacter nyackensis]